MPDDVAPTITEQERKILEERQSALAAAAEAVKDGVVNYNACLAALQEVAAAITPASARTPRRPALTT